MNLKRYELIHDEVMRRLEEGEITTEQAEEINDIAFDRYILATEYYKDKKELKEDKRDRELATALAQDLHVAKGALKKFSSDVRKFMRKHSLDIMNGANMTDEQQREFEKAVRKYENLFNS